VKKKKKFQLKLIKAKKQPKQALNTCCYRFGNKTVKLKIEKIGLFKEPDLSSKVFYYRCFYCDKDFGADIQTCPECTKPLTKINLKKCSKCNAKSSPVAATCWVCNEPFPKLEVKREKETANLLTLDMDGKTYRSTDESLSDDLKKLFADLLASGFDKNVFEAWAKQKELKTEIIRGLIKRDTVYLKHQLRRRNTVNITVVIISILILSLLIWMFWPRF